MIDTSEIPPQVHFSESSRLLESLFELAKSASVDKDEKILRESYEMVFDLIKKISDPYIDIPAGDNFWKSENWQKEKPNVLEIHRKLIREYRNLINQIKNDVKVHALTEIASWMEKIDVILFNSGHESSRSIQFVYAKCVQLMQRLRAEQRELKDDELEMVKSWEVAMSDWSVSSLRKENVQIIVELIHRIKE